MANRRASTSATKRILSALILFCLPLALIAGGPGFRSKRQFDDHFVKHGAEFGKITKQQYLQMAQEFRDAPKGGDILEVIRPQDGVVSRYHKRHRWFLAFNKDRTIRTFFVPNDGENYFWRQAKRPAGR